MNSSSLFLLVRRLRRFLAGPSREVEVDIFARQTAASARVIVLVRLYYVALSYFAVTLLPEWDGFLHHPGLDPLWPVAWLPWFPAEEGRAAILLLYLGGTVLASFVPGSRLARALAWLGLFEFVAFNNSFGKIGHSLHAALLVGFVLVFLPSGDRRDSRLWRQKTVHVFWLAQLVFLLVYSMAGLGKICGFFYQLFAGQMTLLNPHSFAAQVAERLLQTDMNSALGDWIIRWYWVGWPFYLGMVYIQFFSLWAAFRPRLLRPWALALVLFHVGSYFIFTIIFAPNILLIGLFLIAAPLARPIGLGPRFWGDLPLVGFLLRRALPRLYREAPCAS